MNTVNKLQLVDGNKLSTILGLLKKDKENRQLQQGIKNVDEFVLEEKRNVMEKLNEHQGENIVEFLKKKNAVKRKSHEVEIGEEEEVEGKKIKTSNLSLSSKLQKHSSDRLNDFFDKKAFRENTSGSVKIGCVIVNKQDLLYDLSHNASKASSFNLTAQEHISFK